MSLDLTKQDPTGETQVKAAFELSWNTLETEVQTFAYYLSLLAFAPFSLSLIKKLFPHQTIEQINNKEPHIGFFWMDIIYYQFF